MAKGKANPALVIWVAEEWWERPEVQALVEAGHHVLAMFPEPRGNGWEYSMPDLILHPAAHKWNDAMWDTPYLKAALSDARKLHRGRKKT